MMLMAVFRVLSVVAALVLGALVFHAGEPNDLRWWIGALPFALWAIGPVIAPCLIAKHGSRRWFSIMMFLYFVVCSICSGLPYYDAFFRSRSSTASLVMVFIPLYEWLGLALLLFICLGIRRIGRSVEKSREVRSGSAINGRDTHAGWR